MKGSGPLSSQFLGLLGFLLPLSQDFGIFCSSLTIFLSTLAFQSQSLTLPLQHYWSYKTLDLGSFELGFLSFLDGERSLDHVIADIVVFLQVEKFADLRGTLGSQTAWDCRVGESGDFIVSLLLYNHRNHGQTCVYAHQYGVDDSKSGLWTREDGHGLG